MKAVIFDLDGVLCYTDEYHYKAWKWLADKLGIYFDETINNRLRGVSRMDCIDIILEKSDKAYSLDEKAKFAIEKNKYYLQLLCGISKNQADKYAYEVLDELKARGILLAIGSSSKNAPKILELLEMKDYFDAIVDGNQVTNSKPDPEIFLLAAQKLGLKPCECIVVEDSKAGIEASGKGGFKAAAVGDAKGALGVDYNLENLKDILRIEM